MEAVEAFLDGEWDSLSKLFSCEDPDLLLHFNGSNLFSNQLDIPSNFLAGDEDVAGADASMFPSYDHNNIIDTNFYCVSQESSNSSEFNDNHHAAAAANGVNFLHNTFDHHSMDLMPVFSDDLMEEILQLKAQMCNDQTTKPAVTGDSCKDKRYALQSSEDNSSENPKKRPRVSRDTQKNKRTPQPKKAKKAIQISNDDEVNNVGGNGQSSSTCSIEDDDDSNASQELNGGSASTAKSRGSRGPATDPQSLYARKRRERINERLRILQNLVPNGTKVDISTMLEEAVHYVKFLQLQIKLLSSDDLWMFAPIAYNGMDMGLYQKIVPNL